MNPLVWCVIGGLAGGAAIFVLSTVGLMPRLENLAVGVFGAFLGGDLLAPMVKGMAPAGVGTFAIAVGVACGLLALLALMRRAVGPMMPHKRKKRS